MKTVSGDAFNVLYVELDLLNITINQFIALSFCLPQEAYTFHKKNVVVEAETIDRFLISLEPYHSMLLLVGYTELMDCVSTAVQNSNAHDTSTTVYELLFIYLFFYLFNWYLGNVYFFYLFGHRHVIVM